MIKFAIINKIIVKSILIIILFISLSGCLENSQLIEWGDAPNINLKTIDGTIFNLSTHFGKIIIIDFMFVNCPPCQLQMEELNKIYDNFKEEIIIISISVLGAGDSDNDLKDFKETNNAEWIFALDTYDEDATIKYNVLSVPKIIIVNKDGDIAYTHNSFTKNNILNGEINKIL